MVLYRVIQILPINNHCLLIDFIFKSIYYQKVKRQLTNRFPSHILHCNSKSLYVSVSHPLCIPFWLNDNYCAWQVNSVIYLHTFALTQAQKERETERGGQAEVRKVYTCWQTFCGSILPGCRRSNSFSDLFCLI